MTLATPPPLIHDFYASLPEFGRQPAQQIMTSPMPRGREKLAFRLLPRHLHATQVNGKKHLVFSHYYLHPNLLKKSALLRERGEAYTTFIGCCIREDNHPLDFFDEVYEVTDYQEMLTLFVQCKAHALHVMIQPWLLGAMALFAKENTRIKTIIEINDSTFFISNEPNAFSCQMEEWLLDKADYFCHRMPTAALQEIRQSRKISSPDLLLPCLPKASLFQQSRPRQPDEPLRLVFAGGVIPPHIARERGHEGHLFDPLINQVCQDTRNQLTFLVNQNARNMFWSEHRPYFDYQDKFTNFQYRPGVPFADLPQVLSDFHVGIYYENSAASSYNAKHFRYNMATKIASYLEAGLPLCVPSSADYLRQLVARHNLGVIYEPAELSHLADIWTPQRLAYHASQVKTYRAGHEMTTLLPKLQKLYH